jgi:hypothetical protein
VDSVDAADVSWITSDRAAGGTLRYALPADFEVYGVLDLTGEDDATEDMLLNALVTDLSHTLIAGWIDRGPWPPPPGDEHHLYYNWSYRFRRVAASDLQGLPPEGEGSFPDLLFPQDRSWLVSLLWDDSWRSIGASRTRARRIQDRLPTFEHIAPDVSLSSTGREPD